MSDQSKLFEHQGEHSSVAVTQDTEAHTESTGLVPMANVDLTQTLPIAQIKARMLAVNELYKEIMVDNVDYGTIPGCGPKPALLKPGAEMLCTLFGLAPDIESNIGNLGDNQREYRIKCKLIHVASGVCVGTGIGSCSTMERKYYARRDGSVNSPADNYNTCLKMAKKRALVDVVLQVTGASRMFTQDIEDMGKGSK